MPDLTLPQSPEELLAQMVSFETVNPELGGPVGEAELAMHLEVLADAWGLQSRRYPVTGDRFNLVISCETAPDAEWLLLESHLDTVGVAGMTVPPFELTAREGRLHARGTCDTKGSGAAMLWALKTYATETDRPRHAGVLFIVDEETRMTGAQAFAR